MIESQKNKKYKVKTPSGYKDFAGIRRTTKSSVVSITFKDGTKLECSKDHRFIVAGQEILGKDVIVGQQLAEGKVVMSTAINLNNNLLYDLIDVEGGSLYITDGVVSHNCDFSTSGQTVVHPQILTWYSETFIQEPIAKRGFDGNMWVWENADYTKSYIVTADVARGDGGDYSAFHIIDVEDCRQVAEYKGQVTTKDYGNLLVAVATEYNDALLVVENANVGWATIQTIIDRGYKNLYYTYKDNVFDPETYLHKQYDLSNRSDGVAGFSMTQKIRPLAVSKLDLYMREKECIIRSKRLLDELYVFVWKNSRAEAQHGYNDDLVMSWMQGLWVRDTALKLRQSGIDLTKMSLNHFRNSKTEAAIYSTKNFGPNPYKVNLGGGNEEDISWLLGG